MSDSTDLERRYRRLLRLYPRAFRREHLEEVLAVLMAGAAPDQRRPRLGEAADLVWGATFTRLRNPTAWEEDHRPEIWICVRLLTGLWLLILTAILCRYHRWWGLALLAPAALHFVLAYRLGRFMARRRNAKDSPPSLPAP